MSYPATKGPLVSIITPTYNHEQYLGSCIESVFMQDYQNWEMLIVDDGSTDKTLDLALSYQEHDHRVRVFPQTHRGIWNLYQTYNVALESARGELIGVLEGDDLWLPYRLGRQIPAFEDERVILAYGLWQRMTEDGRVETINPSRPEDERDMLNQPPGTALRVLLTRNPIVPCTALIARSALERVGGFQKAPGFPAVDFPTWLHLALEGEFRFVNAPLGCWRMHRQQSTHQLVVELAEGSRDYALEFFRKLGSDMQRRSQWSETSLARCLESKVALAHAQAGRRRLMEAHRQTAIRHFLTALWRGDPMTKAKAAAGLLCAVSGVNLERVAQVLGRPHWS